MTGHNFSYSAIPKYLQVMYFLVQCGVLVYMIFIHLCIVAGKKSMKDRLNEYVKAEPEILTDFSLAGHCFTASK